MANESITATLEAVSLLAWAGEQQSIRTEKEALFFALFGVASPHLVGEKCVWAMPQELISAKSNNDLASVETHTLAPAYVADAPDDVKASMEFLLACRWNRRAV